MKRLAVVLAVLFLSVGSAAGETPIPRWFLHASKQQPINGQKGYLAAVVTENPGHPNSTRDWAATCAIGRITNGVFRPLYRGRISHFSPLGGGDPTRACYVSFPKRLNLVGQRLFVRFTVTSAGSSIPLDPLRLRAVARHCC